jgi:hypothetical protein
MIVDGQMRASQTQDIVNSLTGVEGYPLLFST